MGPASLAGKSIQGAGSYFLCSFGGRFGMGVKKLFPWRLRRRRLKVTKEEHREVVMSNTEAAAASDLSLVDVLHAPDSSQISTASLPSSSPSASAVFSIFHFLETCL